ncbi:Hypp9730 [Branchiostoma lanceolatum]|uniref:Hypp9730 protein n=1 Tax=Branchiostoma lanceolatum TaxID=7740 RepID=A0A8S4MPI0_BRALA|nr:Hypp9730 [Branchiostoma lanceolatum]
MGGVKTLLILGIVLLICKDLIAGWKSRRRCNNWNWNAWSACSAPCGNAGTQTRTASGCGAPGPQTQPCNRFCHNGGTLLTASCSCPKGFAGTCCEMEVGE